MYIETWKHNLKDLLLCLWAMRLLYTKMKHTVRII